MEGFLAGGPFPSRVFAREHGLLLAGRGGGHNIAGNDRLTPHATGGVYVNFMPEDETRRVRVGAYGPNYERLAKIKSKYDPKNLFRHNQNITPAA